MLISKSMSKELQSIVEKAKREMVENAANDLCSITKKITEEENFSDAIHVENDDGDHALLVLEEQIAEEMRRNPILINIMRSSGEWDEDVRLDDPSIAAYALVNEAIPFAEDLWDNI